MRLDEISQFIPARFDNMEGDSHSVPRIIRNKRSDAIILSCPVTGSGRDFLLLGRGIPTTKGSSTYLTPDSLMTRYFPMHFPALANPVSVSEVAK